MELINEYWPIGILLAIVLFMAYRQVALWYYKIDKRVELLEAQNEILKKIFVQLGGEITDLEDEENINRFQCPNCESDIEEGFVKCPFCQTKLPK